ncbi:TetR/AcrR family transcriptional regulator [Peterkaempfera bronchialis]|uniref:TetR/AcrR family transcriptional regulator n=1 Tax=Peterkaempfera bronchialis TaxID=2126346 RepID=A0A345SVR5_9ACTN|nr:TetR/AcrR family transcriptional regulator [Peterkaempfera bronchialis]AXI77820.1 TetR/AcrR family transcriptional regulator [Peterkaempfera bronchialis]
MTATTPADLWPEVRPEAARRLLLAAVESFARRGYHATTTRDIATAAGMSPAALYVHYPSKAALLSEISRTGHQRTLALVEGAAAEATDPVRRMRRLVEDFTAWHARAHTVGRIVQYELRALPPEDFAVVAELRRRTEETVRALIAEGVAAGVFEVDDVRTTARAVLSLGIDVARWYNERTAEPPEELGRRYADLVLRMLGTRPVA